VGIILIAIILRLGAAFFLGETMVGEEQKRIQDQVSYNLLAQSLLAGRGYSFERYWYPFTPPNTPTAHWSFLYPLYLAGVYAITGYHPLAARLLQAVICGIVSVLLFYRLGRRLFGEPVGMMAALLGAVYSYFVYHDAALMTEPFYNLGVLASFDLALTLAGFTHHPSPITSRTTRNTQHTSRFTPLPWIFFGLTLGLTALLRQTILLWAPFLFAWIIFYRHSSLSSNNSGAPPSLLAPLSSCHSLRSTLSGISLTLLVMALLILPWTVRNAIVFHAFLPLNSNAGYALYTANHPYHGTHFDQDHAEDIPAELAGLNEAQLSIELTRRGLGFILQDPQRYLLLSLSRAPIFFNFWFSSESSLTSNLMRVLSFGLYLPFFLAGLWLSRRDWPVCSLFYLFVVVYSAMHILTWASIRYRLPVDAALMPFAALAVVYLARRILSFRA
jgi:hypothetical protein